MAVNLLLLDVAEGVIAGWGIIITLETESTCKSLIYCTFQMCKINQDIVWNEAGGFEI